MSAKILMDIRSIIEQNDIQTADALISRIHALDNTVDGTSRLFFSLTTEEQSVLTDFDAMQKMARGVCLLMLAAKALHVHLEQHVSLASPLTHVARNIFQNNTVTMNLHGALVTQTLDGFIDNLGNLVLKGDLNSLRTRRLYQQCLTLVPQITHQLITDVLHPSSQQGLVNTQNVKLIDIISQCLTFFESWLDAADSAAV
eukprot:19527-Rhodomonas_salina.1